MPTCDRPAIDAGFALSNELDSDTIDANLKDGLLSVRIPERAEMQPRKIEVRTS